MSPRQFAGCSFHHSVKHSESLLESTEERLVVWMIFKLIAVHTVKNEDHNITGVSLRTRRNVPCLTSVKRTPRPIADTL